MNGEQPATKADLAAVKDELRNELTEVMRGIETNLLTEFHRYAKSQHARLHSLEINDSDVKLRLSSIEERILALEMRRPPTV